MSSYIFRPDHIGGNPYRGIGVVLLSTGSAASLRDAAYSRFLLLVFFLLRRVRYWPRQPRNQGKKELFIVHRKFSLLTVSIAGPSETNCFNL